MNFKVNFSILKFSLRISFLLALLNPAISNAFITQIILSCSASLTKISMATRHALYIRQVNKKPKVAHVVAFYRDQNQQIREVMVVAENKSSKTYKIVDIHEPDWKLDSVKLEEFLDFDASSFVFNQFEKEIPEISLSESEVLWASHTRQVLEAKLRKPLKNWSAPSNERMDFDEFIIEEHKFPRHSMGSKIAQAEEQIAKGAAKLLFAHYEGSDYVLKEVKDEELFYNSFLQSHEFDVSYKGFTIDPKTGTRYMVSRYHSGVLANFIYKGHEVKSAKHSIERLTIRGDSLFGLGKMIESAYVKYPEKLFNEYKISEKTFEEILRKEKLLWSLGIEPYDFQVIISPDGGVNVIDLGEYYYAPKLSGNDIIVTNHRGELMGRASRDEFRKEMLRLFRSKFNPLYHFDRINLSLAERMVLALKRLQRNQKASNH